MKFKDFLIIFFALAVLSKHTIETYQSYLRKHILPQLGDIELGSITRTMIRNIIIPMSPQSAATTLAILKSLFREAMNLGLVESSPVHGLRGPKVQVPPRRFLTWEELSEINFGKYDHHIKFLALHGLRWSEAVALTVDDIRAERIYVTKSIHGGTKSLAGLRTVPLVMEFQPFPRHPRTLRKVLAPHRITIHSLRHTYAYILKKQGVHVTTAQKLLGHSDPKVTLKVYTQVLDSEIDDVGKMLIALQSN